MRKIRNKISLCKENLCDNAEVFCGYCRLHYIKNWNRIKKSNPHDKKMRVIQGGLSQERKQKKTKDDFTLSDYAITSYPEDDFSPDVEFDIDSIIDNLKIEE